jgi:hypothetical protein
MAEDIQLPDEFLNLSNAVERYPETLASGNNVTQTAALNATKFVFDLGELFFFFNVQALMH